MNEAHRSSFYTSDTIYLSPLYAANLLNSPFQHHSQFPIIINTLSRKHCHHLVLCSNFLTTVKRFLLEGLLAYLPQAQTNHLLRLSDMTFVDTEQLVFPDGYNVLKKELEYFYESLHTSKHFQLIAFSNANIFLETSIKTNPLSYLLQCLLTHPNCRVIVFAQTNKQLQHQQQHFNFLTLDALNQTDIVRILKRQSVELGQYHEVIIPDDVLLQAYALAKRYIDPANPLKDALLLLDSSAATASIKSKNPNMLTATTLLEVLSQRIKIPATHLQWEQFDVKEFTQGMQECLFGQDAALALIGQEIKRAQTALRLRTGPLFHFLLSGPEATGKKTAAIALTQQLFKQIHVLYFASMNSIEMNSLADLKVKRASDHEYTTLKDAIQQTPYAVFMLENIDQSSSIVLKGLHEILTTGVLHDHENAYHFQQSIFLFSTQVGASHLSELAKTFAIPIVPYHVDLTQLLLNEHKKDTTIAQYYSPQELVNEILPEITTHLPFFVYQSACVVPFLPLTKIALEKILHLTLRELKKQLDEYYHIELGFAPEVIQYLINQILNIEEDRQSISVHQAIEQLYYCVEHSFMNYHPQTCRFKQLFLQLNETGELLRCDWLEPV